MAEPLLPGAVMGVAVQQLYSAIGSVIGRCSRFKSLLKKLQCTIDVVRPGIEKIDELLRSCGDNYPKKDIHSLILLLNKAQWLVSTCSDVKTWNVYKMYKYQKRLEELDVSLSWLLPKQMQILEWKTVLPILVEILEKNKKLDQHVLEQPETDGNAIEGNLSNARVETQMIPSNPEITSEGNSSGFRFYWSYSKKDKNGERLMTLLLQRK